MNPALITALLATTVLGAAENVRIDLRTTDRSELTGLAVAEGTGKVVEQTWENRKGTLLAHFSIPPRAWTRVGFSFTPTADCDASLILMGPWRMKADGSKEVERIMVVYDDLAAEGSTIDNPGFEELGAAGAPKSWKMIGADGAVVGEGAKAGARAVRAWNGGSFVQGIRLHAGRPVTIRAWAWSENDPAAK